MCVSMRFMQIIAFHAVLNDFLSSIINVFHEAPSMRTRSRNSIKSVTLIEAFMIIAIVPAI